MIVYKRFAVELNRFNTKAIIKEGWYLFGFIPLYIRKIERTV